MRSTKYPTHYRVGSLNGKDVYLHPQMGFSIEREDRLVKMTSEELKAGQQTEQTELSELEQRLLRLEQRLFR